MESPSEAQKHNSAFLMILETGTIRRKYRLNGGKSQLSSETAEFGVFDDFGDWYYSAEISTKRWNTPKSMVLFGGMVD